MSQEADKIMDVVAETKSQIPISGPGVVVLAGGGRTTISVFGHKTAERMVERFREMPEAYENISGAVVLKSLFVPEVVASSATFVPNTSGPSLSLELLQKGFPGLEVWSK